MGCFTSDSSGTSRSYYTETTDTLAAQLALAPNLYTAESTYQPLYTQLGVNNAYTALFGNQGRNGLLNLYEEISPVLTKIGAQERTDSRLSDVADVGRLGYGALLAEQVSDPKKAAMLNTLTDQSMNDLKLGSNLNPAETRQAEQTVRTRQEGMLGGTGSAGDLGEAMGISSFGQQLKQQRRSNASDVINLRQQVFGDPFQQVLGRSSVGNNPMSATSQAQGFSSGSVFNPESSYASNIYGSNAAYSSLYSDPSTVSKISSIMGLGNSGSSSY